MTTPPYTLVVEAVPPPVIVLHGGAGSYVRTTTKEQRAQRGALLMGAAERGYDRFAPEGARGAVLTAIAELERAVEFNAGYGSRLQRDGVARLSAALMDGRATRLSSIYNARGCLHPSRLAAALQSRADRNLDGDGAAALMVELGMAPTEVVTAITRERWQRLVDSGDQMDREAAIGDAGRVEVDQARAARLPVPHDLERLASDEEPAEASSGVPFDPHGRHGTVGAVACDAAGALWACTSTGGRGHEAVGRISDSPTPAGNYACPAVALSATGFGEQILDLNLCGRIATRMLDGSSLRAALERTFDEAAAFGALVGVIAVSASGRVGYAHTTEACGVAWLGAGGARHLDRHGRST